MRCLNCLVVAHNLNKVINNPKFVETVKNNINKKLKVNLIVKKQDDIQPLINYLKSQQVWFCLTFFEQEYLPLFKNIKSVVDTEFCDLTDNTIEYIELIKLLYCDIIVIENNYNFNRLLVDVADVLKKEIILCN